MLTPSLLAGLLASAIALAPVPEVRYEPSPMPVVQVMLELGRVGAGDVVYDLGCGDGRIVIAAARRGARGVCVDIDPERIAEARANAAAEGVGERIRFEVQDLFDTDVREATVVMLFLSHGFNRKLRPKLQQQLRPGTRLVSHWHDMGDWPPAESAKVRVGSQWHPVYAWTIGGR